MAVMVPFLVIGMMGMLDLGRAFYYQIAITNAVREGARYAATPYYLGLNPSCNSSPQPPGANCPAPGDDVIKLRVHNELKNTGFDVQDSDITVNPPENIRESNFAGGTSGYPIEVTATFKFNFITPIIGSLIGDPLTISTSSWFRTEY